MVKGVHHNSILAWELYDLGSRIHTVAKCLGHKGPCTDREVLDAIGGRDMNEVRPSITKMVQDGSAVETHSVRCSTTQRMVRVVRLATQDEWERAQRAAKEPRATVGDDHPHAAAWKSLCDARGIDPDSEVTLRKLLASIESLAAIAEATAAGTTDKIYRRRIEQALQGVRPRKEKHGNHSQLTYPE